MDVRFNFDDLFGVKIAFDGQFEVKDVTSIGKIRILMLKGEKGDKGDNASYNDLTDKPTINNVVISGDKSLADFSVYSITQVDDLLSEKVPNTRTVNGKALSSDITLDYTDVDAVPTTRTVNDKALSADITLTPADIGAVEKTGDNMTGGITWRLGDGSWAQFLQVVGAAFRAGIATDANNQLVLQEQKSGSSYFESYYLPQPTKEDDYGYYNILTTKNTVTVPQGGTGAADAAGARTNLGLGDMATESKTSYLAISELAANTDLNNVRTFGFYSMGGWSNMSSITHKPASDYACLAVLPIVSATSGAYCVHYWFGRSGLWRSDYSNGTWSVWTNITTGATVART